MQPEMCGHRKCADIGNVMTKHGLIIAVLLVLAGPRPGAVEGREPRSFPFDNESYVALSHLAFFYGFGRVEEEGDDFILRSSWTRLRFTRDSRKMEVNGVRVWLHGPVRRVRRRWAVSESDVQGVIDPLLRTDRHLEAKGFQRVVLDPGHGGNDQGAIGPGGLREKDLTLDIARRVRSMLAQAGVQVLMTREFDRTTSLADRVQQTKASNADVFVSIHFNTAGNRQAHGTETFVLTRGGRSSTASGNPGTGIPEYPGNRFDGANAILGYYVQRRTLEQTGNFDRGVRRSRFAVLRDAPCPAVLIECAFLSHAPEEARLESETYRDAIAQGIAEGIMDYLRAVRKAGAK